MTLERRENYSVSAPFPGFTPSLSQPAPVAMLITKSHKLGTGGFLYYNGNMDGFQTLTEQADRSGLDRDNYDVDNDNRRGNATYTRGTSSIVVDADVSIGAINSDSWKGVPMFNLFSYDNDDTEDYEYESQLMVTSLEVWFYRRDGNGDEVGQGHAPQAPQSDRKVSVRSDSKATSEKSRP